MLPHVEETYWTLFVSVLYVRLKPSCFFSTNVGALVWSSKKTQAPLQLILLLQRSPWGLHIGVHRGVNMG